MVGKAAALFHENGDPCVAETCPETEPNETRAGTSNRIMTTVDGTIITGKEHHNGNNESNNGSPDEPGAHMGLDVQFLRFDNGTLAIGPITLECTSPDVDTTPDRWLCNVKAEVQEPGFILLVTALTLPITLNKVVNPLEVPACSVFQDSGGALPISGDLIVVTPPGAPVAPPIGCGDNNVTSPEQCDDGNTTDGDGCSSTCTVEAPPTTPIGCGDSNVTSPEQCDDGNTTDGDGCSATCTVEAPDNRLR